MNVTSTTENLVMSDGTPLTVTIGEMTGEMTTSPRAILFLHGWPSSGRVWNPLIDALSLAVSAAEPLRFITPDLRGFGESHTATTGYTCERFALDILDIAAALDLRTYLLVGHSMSGKIAQLVAAKRPPGLTALALIAPTALSAAHIPAEKIALQKAAQGDPEKTAAIVLGMLVRPIDEATRTRLVEDGLNAAPEAWNGWLETMREEELSEQAGQISVPTLVVAAEADPLRTPETVKANVASTIAGATFATIPGSGHLPHIEDPITLAALLINFLDGLPKGIGE